MIISIEHTQIGIHIKKEERELSKEHTNKEIQHIKI